MTVNALLGLAFVAVLAAWVLYQVVKEEITRVD